MLVLTLALFVAALGLGLLAWRLWQEERRRSEARVAALSAAIDGQDLPFEAERRSAVQGQPLVKVAIGLAAAVAVTVLIAMTGAKHDAPAAALSSASSLELLSMTHARDGELLTVTGLVRNSGRGRAQGIAAVVFAFDRSGGFVTSGRSPLEERTLGPGEESPFQVVIHAVQDVGRYRVSFRNEAGVIRHVDRRRNGTASGALKSLRAAS